MLAAARGHAGARHDGAVLIAVRARPTTVPGPTAGCCRQAPITAPLSAAPAAPDQALREVSAEHLERSKLVVLGLATRDPHHTAAADWQYERRLAGSRCCPTRVCIACAAQDRGVADVARVMRDLETVLLEASMSDSTDRMRSSGCSG